MEDSLHLENGSNSQHVTKKKLKTSDNDSSKKLIKNSSEKSPLLNEEGSVRELVSINRDLSNNIDGLFLKNNLLFKTALVIYPPGYDFEKKENISLDVLYSFDTTIFDRTTVPRKAIKCCGPIPLELIKGAAALTGAAGVFLSMTEYTNGVLEPLFGWTPGGPISWTALGVSTFLTGPVAILVFRDIAKSTLEKNRSVLIPTKSGESEGCHYARVFPKSKGHKFLEFLLIPASGTYAAIPTLQWVLFQEPFPATALLPASILLYFAEPYFRIGQDVVHNWYANNFYTTAHSHKETRRAFIASLSDIEKALDKDIKGKIINTIWDLLKKRTKNFGRDTNSLKDEEDDRQLFSALSLLLSKPYVVDTEDDVAEVERGQYTQYYNRGVITASIKEQTRREKVASFLAKFLMGASLVPSYFTEQRLISQTLSQWGAGDIASDVTGYSLSALASTRILLEQEIHRRNFMKFPSPVTGESDHRYVRGALGVKTAAFALLNSFIFAGITYTALNKVPSPMREIMTAFVGLRYFSLFFYVGSYKYNKATTNIVTRNKNKTSLEEKKAAIQRYIRKAKKSIKYELTDETIAELARGIFNVQ
jgi:hypothetical protein